MNKWKIIDDSFWVLLDDRSLIFVPLCAFNEQAVDEDTVSWSFGDSEREINKMIESTNNSEFSYCSGFVALKILKSKVSVSMGILNFLA